MPPCPSPAPDPAARCTPGTGATAVAGHRRRGPRATARRGSLLRRAHPAHALQPRRRRDRRAGGQAFQGRRPDRARRRPPLRAGQRSAPGRPGRGGGPTWRCAGSTTRAASGCAPPTPSRSRICATRLSSWPAPKPGWAASRPRWKTSSSAPLSPGTSSAPLPRSASGSGAAVRSRR